MGPLHRRCFDILGSGVHQHRAGNSAARPDRLCERHRQFLEGADPPQHRQAPLCGYADLSEVAQVIAGYQLQSAIGGSFTVGNFNAALVGPFTASGSANAAGTYTDRPTVIYSPLTSVDFLKRLMTPIPPSSVLFILQSGYSAERIMPIMLDSINGINNESNRLRRPADPKFTASSS
jgi:hypothetical protein